MVVVVTENQRKQTIHVTKKVAAAVAKRGDGK